MERRYRRWLAFATARLKRATTTARQAVMTDVDVTRDTRAADLAEAEAFAHALPESFPLFRRHVLAALFHATAETGATGSVPSKSAEEDPAQRQKSKRLPEGDLAPAEERRQQPIPQVQHYFAADDGK